MRPTFALTLAALLSLTVPAEAAEARGGNGKPGGESGAATTAASGDVAMSTADAAWGRVRELLTVWEVELAFELAGRHRSEPSRPGFDAVYGQLYQARQYERSRNRHFYAHF